MPTPVRAESEVAPLPKRTAAAKPKVVAPARPEPKPFGPGSAMWDDMGDIVFLSLTPGAFLLQVMHPVIATVVDEHSVFRTDTKGRAIRSLDSMLLWVYGGQAAIDEGARLRRLHRDISSTDETTGKRMHALDPEAYAWVHGTAFVTAMTVHPLLRGREATRDEQERFYDEFVQLGEILRVPPRLIPQTVDEYWDYYTTMLRERLEPTPLAHELIRMHTHPPVRLAPGPVDPAGWAVSRGAGHLLRLLLLGGLRQDARDLLGIRWTAADDAQLRALMTAVRPVHRRLPERLRYVPLALQARRYARELSRAHARAIPV